MQDRAILRATPMPDADANPTSLGEPAPRGDDTPALCDVTEHAEDGGSAERVVTQAGQRAGRSTLPTGAVLGRYRVLGVLGRGGMGVVLRARDEVIGRTVALKVLHTEADRQALRLRREAQAMAQLSHPNIVQVYEVGKAEGHWFIAMELVEGQTLSRWQQGDHGWRERLAVYLRAGEGLAAAHAAGLVHRDFKPDNCIVDRSGRPRVLDFGLVRGPVSSFGDESLESHPGLDPAQVLLTQTGAVMGTAAYMSLEQLGGRTVDARSDQFSFCVALYESLYGERPFVGDTVGRLTIALMNAELRPPPAGTRVPPRVRSIVLRGLALDPGQRWPTMDALLAELRQVVRPRRSGAWLAAAAAGVVVVAGSWLLWPKAEVVQCQDARAQLAGTWDDERRGALEAAILGTDLPYAADASARISSQLDAHATAWIEAHVRACEATHVHRVQDPQILDLRMHCLMERRTELREAVGVLLEASPQRVRQGVALVSGLARPSRCDDVAALRAVQSLPDEPAEAERVRALREQLALISSLSAIEEHVDALARAEVVAEQAEALGYLPLVAEALYQRGQLYSAGGHYAEAEADLDRAYLIAVEQGDDRLAVRAVGRLIHVVGHQRADHERGLWWSKTGLALAERLGSDPDVMADLLGNTGSVLADQGKLDEALDHYRRSLALEEDAGGQPLAIARILVSTGGVLSEQGELDQALDEFRQALSMSEQVLGPWHPKVAAVLNNIGTVLGDQGKHQEALESYRRALTIWEQVYGPDHPHVGSVLANLSTALIAQGQTDEALADLERAFGIWERTLGPTHPQVGQLHVNIAQALRFQGRDQQAYERLRQGLAILEEALGPEHHDLGVVLESMGETLRHLDRTVEAVECYERAIGVWERSMGPGYPKIAMALVGLAELALERGDHEAARAPAVRALELRESGQVASEQLAEARFLLARVLWPEPGERARARSLAEQARVSFENSSEFYAGHAADVAQWLDRHPP
ncbi:serine/threonine-protein kinase [Paraliomyxa miuraensis]|uniref:serine/threonine-protein kinase n=1 Tax=Paraliomyxa miuraensis TaxID=376150 RepID=UPI00225709D0|nr:serine/threonine-protein kinase [Paraliomyxa miuraensis]MCX4241964.1 serine/threonine-protein kinase [Paraliomyxa miuraensis]